MLLDHSFIALFADVPVLDTLLKFAQLGAIGIAIVLAYFTYDLLTREQARDPIREPILRSIKNYMWLVVFVCLVAGACQGFDMMYKASQTRTDLDAADKELKRLRVTYESFDLMYKVDGEIAKAEQVSPGALKDLRCSGTVRNLVDGLHLWLVVEIDGFIYPKEPELTSRVKPEKQWTADINHDGPAKDFSISLVVANKNGNETIREWFDKAPQIDPSTSRPYGYTKMSWPKGVVRVHRMDAARIVRKSPR